MSITHRVKVFKSGNSLAVRLPKSLGLEEGAEVMMVPHADGSISFWRTSDNAKKLASLYGAFSPGFMAGGRGDDSQEARDWNAGPRGAAA
jgi:antitoxin VapB